MRVGSVLSQLTGGDFSKREKKSILVMFCFSFWTDDEEFFDGTKKGDTSVSCSV